MESRNNSRHINHVLKVERRIYEQEQLNAELQYSCPKNGKKIKQYSKFL